MLFSTFLFILLVNDSTLASIILSKKALPFLYKTGAKIVKLLALPAKKQIEEPSNIIKPITFELAEYNANFFNKIEVLETSYLFNLDCLILRIVLFSFVYYYYNSFSNYNIDTKNYKDYKIGLITWNYLTGLIETDGSFKISLDKSGKYKPIVSISQKENTQLLDKIKDFLKLYKINSTLDISDPQKSNRAPQLRIQGSLQVLKFCELLEKNVNSFYFCSQKYRDFLILKTALSDLNSDPSIKIDLMLSLHKTSLNEPDINVYKNKTSRNAHEKRLGLTKNASINSAKFLLEKIDEKFYNHTENIKISIVNKLNIFNNDWCVGVMDGDGCFSISMEFDTNKHKIKFIPSFQLVMEKKAKLTIEMFRSIIDCEGRLIQHKNNKQEVTAIYYRINKLDELNKIINFFTINNTRNIVKAEQLKLIIKLLELKEQNKLNDYEVVTSFIKQCYEVTELGKGKGKRKFTLSEALKNIDNWFNKPNISI